MRVARDRVPVEVLTWVFRAKPLGTLSRTRENNVSDTEELRQRRTENNTHLAAEEEEEEEGDEEDILMV